MNQSLLIRAYLKPYCLAILILGVSWATSQAAWAQDSFTAGQAYEHLQTLRRQADDVLGSAAQPPADSLQKAGSILQTALAYYHRADVQALAKDDKFLLGKKGDILYDLALIQAKSGQKAAATQSLLTILSGKRSSLYAKYIKQEPLFAPMRQESVLAARFAVIDAFNNVFYSNALRTPYQPNISEDEKLAGLSKLWSEAKYNFAYFDHIPTLDWDQLYLRYIPKVRATTSTLQYLRVMQEFCAHLKDGHTDVSVRSDTLGDLIYGSPPFRTWLIEDKVLVKEVWSDSLAKTGIRPGMEVIKVGDLSVHEYAAQHVKPYQSGSTPQNVNVETYTYGLLKGPRDQPISLEFRDAKGKSFRRILPRSGYSHLQWRPSFLWHTLPGNIAYVQLNEFVSDRASKAFATAFDSISTANALILDVRLNGGGDSHYGWDIIGYLTDSSFQTSSYSSRLYSPLLRAQGEGVEYEAGGRSICPANGKKVFRKPVVLLISGQTFSAAEDFTLAFDALQRGKLIGEPTGGSTGYPMEFDLPGGLKARICTKRDTYPDGREWVGKGIQPSILVKPTVAAIQAGRDLVLEAALQYLKSQTRKK
ncbi:MAG: S41 family peptidase [Bacteroidota bacterium]